MKNKMINRILYIQCIWLAGILLSCSQDEKVQDTSCQGTPHLVSVTTTTDFKIPLSSCNLGDWITVHGTDMCASKEISVNGVKVNMREVFLESDKITLQVPREIAPGGSTNQIEVTNGQVASKLDIQVNVPNLILYGLDNEYAKIGDTIKVNGENFDLYEVTPENGKVFIGNQEARMLNMAANYLTIVIPDGAAQGDRIRVTCAAADKLAPGRYKDDRGIFENFDPYRGWSHGELITDGTNPGDPKPCSGKYTHVIKDLGSWEWFDFVASWYKMNMDAINNPQNYYYKFEVLTLKSLTKKTVGINQTNFQWKPWEGSEFSTYGKWKTITIEFTAFMNGKKFDEAFTAIDDNDYSNRIVQITLTGGDPESVNICFDNFRIVPKD